LNHTRALGCERQARSQGTFYQTAGRLATALTTNTHMAAGAPPKAKTGVGTVRPKAG